MVNGRFTAVGSVTLDATGGGSVTLSPPGVDWVVLTTTVSTSTTTKEPRAMVYHNGIGPSSYVEDTRTAGSDVSDTRHLVTAGEDLTVVFVGGDPGATATVRLAGLQTPPGEGLAVVGG